ncbi:MAG: malto-oligosyltrehalose synthase [Gemmatimonadaceae bacterium]
MGPVIAGESGRAARPLGATYRMQLHGEFPLAAARGVVGYLRALGVTHLYASPVLQARRGSRHGYDVVDPTIVSPALGGDAAWRGLAEALHGEGLGAVLDVVPNHMGTGGDNPYWTDVLQRGKASRWAHWFDVDWDAPSPYTGRVMLPVLGDELDAVIARGELQIVDEAGQLAVAYFDNRYPLSPESVAELVRGDPARRFAGEEGRSRLRALLDRQHYALTFWRRAAREINYRRFFDVNDLVALRAEDPRVFEETHARVLEWVADGTLDGIRIDHVDGLLDPRAYLERLRAAVAERRPGAQVPIFVEKILSPGERLREGWPVQGTTGYEFLNLVEDVFVDPAGFRRIESAYLRLTGREGVASAFREEALRGKREILRGALQADVTRLARLLGGPADGGVVDTLVECMASLPVYRTYVDGSGSMHEDDRAFLEIALAGARARGSEKVVERIEAAFEAAAKRDDAKPLTFARRFQQTSGPATAKGVEDTAIYRYFPLASRNEVGGSPETPLDDAVRAFHAANAERRARWPRNLLCTNTHDTKRSADVRARLEALSEIPEEWLAAVERWRAANASLRATTPGGPAPDANDEYLAYQTIVGAWPVAPPGEAPAGEALASFRDRVKAYMEKAIRESKRITSWTAPDEAYERGVAGFVEGLLREGSPFVREAAALVGRISRAAMWTALSRVALHLTSPGTPDVYQGDELWNLALVDPDNRRPVDYALRARLLAELDARDADGPTREALAAELVAAPEDGRVKLWTVSRLLRARRERLSLFADGDYVPLEVRGERAAHLVAFVRREGGRVAVALAPRLALTLAGGAPPVGAVWGDTTVALPTELAGAWLRCVLNGRAVEVGAAGGGASLRIADALRSLPAGVLLGSTT